ncbi:hypothetical protein [Arsenicicoccus sp. oral taxon 190]|uniref:hypothetical protein n=1 Tax=Arsenicicoccus sp. oral taxon 190 TaxID=1658671 RepID=UPI00067A32C6|nr:hypothetical protein [Arsenicicoccus sp. oral taxon 190]AKT51030.1 hypothetical protein ADJ73_06355 [Arsenicicoccus sp. oral taxon 190]
MTDLARAVRECLEIEGALGAALVDVHSGMALETAGEPATVNLDVAAAGNSAVVQAKLRTMTDLGLDDEIEDILITLGRQYHMIRPISSREGRGLFLYLVLDKTEADLDAARSRLAVIEREVQL